MNVIDHVKDFALHERRLFPCDTATLTKASAEAFDREGGKLRAHEKIAAARHIARRADELGLDLHEHLVAAIAHDELSPMFKVALSTRREKTAWNEKAMQRLNIIEKVANRISTLDGEMRRELLDKLAGLVEEFDRTWDKDKSWRDAGVPDAVDTVFRKEAQERDVVLVGERQIRPADLQGFDKEAAKKVLTPETVEMAGSWASFRAASSLEQAAISSFIR